MRFDFCSQNGKIDQFKKYLSAVTKKGQTVIAALTVVLVVMISLIVVRVATVGLTLTGVSKDLAQFQALSAFTGSGFTTKESEEMVNHPIRRRIVMHLMLLGNVGLVLVIAAMLRFFLLAEADDDWYDQQSVRIGALMTGVLLLWIVATSRHIETIMWKVHIWALTRWTRIDVQDYVGLLRLAHDYAVSEIKVHHDDWVAGRTLAELQLANEGVLVLGIERADGKYIGSPRGTTLVLAEDGLILYGPQQRLLELDTRRAGFDGNVSHVIAVTRQINVQEEEDTPDPDPDCS